MTAGARCAPARHRWAHAEFKRLLGTTLSRRQEPPAGGLNAAGCLVRPVAMGPNELEDAAAAFNSRVQIASRPPDQFLNTNPMILDFHGSRRFTAGSQSSGLGQIGSRGHRSAGRADERMALRKCPDRIEQCSRGLDLRQMTGIRQELALRTGYRASEFTAVVGVDDLVAVTPDHECGCPDTRQPRR